MSKSRYPGWVLAAGLSAIVLAASACGGGAGSEAAGGGGPEGSIETLNVGISVSSVAFLPLHVAESEGIFEKHGLDVNLLSFKGGTEVLRAIVGGNVEVGAGPATDVLVAGLTDTPVKMFWGFNEASVYELWGRAGASLEDAADLSFAVSGLNGQSHQVTMYMLQGAGQDPSAAEYVVAGGPAERLAAIQTGQVDAGLLSEPTSFIAEREGLVRLGALRDYVDNWQNEVLYAQEDLIGAQTDTLHSFVEATNEAIDLIDTNPDVAVNVIVEEIGYSPEDAAASLESYRGTWPKDGRPAEQGIQVLAEFQAESEGTEVLTLEDIMDWRLVDQFGGR